MSHLTFSERILALHYVFPVPLNRLSSLLQRDPNLERIGHAEESELAILLNISVDKAQKLQNNYLKTLETPLLQAYKAHKIIPIPFNHPLYPTRLLALYDPPVVLYTKGDSAILENKRKIAIIGARNATTYTDKVLNFIVPPLIEHEFVIVSGLAKGADRKAHEATIRFSGKTVGVLGHGLFHLYPKENKKLAEQMEINQLLISEYPPYVKPQKWHFPMRNRIISGLSTGIVVTEAAEKSGTLSTIDHGLETGKTIFAVPGDITNPLSKGPHKLIAEGAKPIWNGYQIIEELEEFLHSK
ncbi:DNA-processing protein DprA [Rummeliibacillus stabekisii]|uniref:DNA-processing protein DprA n=1 Tax=Rummeliibacillus stabekisii TaxID=241244 RepID=UPI00203E2FE0|nr:DNA-processing protein DprA [Rummeliibacillus stabekisii]MCM3315801.1 DNA-processing protein DprA [Rummeliibacillus stabekisii]